MSLETVLQEQSHRYQHHLAIRNKAKKALQYQHNIRAFKTIPKHFLPQRFLQLVQPTTPLTSDFQKRFDDLFFQHLNDVITSNTITLELAEAQLKDTIQYTTKILAESTKPTAIVTEQYQKFMSENNITEPYTPPELLKRGIQGSLKGNHQGSTTQKSSSRPLPQKKSTRKRKKPNVRNAKKRQKNLIPHIKYAPKLQHNQPTFHQNHPGPRHNHLRFLRLQHSPVTNPYSLHPDLPTSQYINVKKQINHQINSIF